MQKKAKKLLAMLLTVLMVLTILPAAVFATEQSTVASPLDSIVPYDANDQVTGTATISPQDPVTYTGYATFANVPYYLVTVPTGTTYVKATYSNAAILINATSGQASGYYADLPQWTGSGVEMAYAESDGNITITIPLSYSGTAGDGTTIQKSFVLGADGSGTAYAPEYNGTNNYAPVHFLAFEYSNKSAPVVSAGAITSAHTTLGNAWLLDVAEMFTDADGDILTYAATINGIAQELDGSLLSYTPTAAGVYTVALTATDDSGTAVHTITLTATEGSQIPRLKSGVSVTASATVAMGYAYNLTDLQAGRIFENPDGSSLSYTDYYYYRRVNNEQTGPYYFSAALFGATTIQITENEAGTYVYEFHASNVHGSSADIWTLTLYVSNVARQNYTFHVGRDMNYSDGSAGNPIIKLYRTQGLDDKGADFIGRRNEEYIYQDDTPTNNQDDGEKGFQPVKFWKNDFTEEIGETQGSTNGNYRDFYAALTPGRYSFRAYGYNSGTGQYDIYLGGHSLTLPTEVNVDGNTGGGTDIYLRLHSIYTTSKKSDNTYFTASDYTARIDMPIMGGEVQHGTPYVSGNYTYYPFMMYSAGNAALWNAYVEPVGPDYVFTRSGNNTTPAGYTVVTKNLSISQAVTMTVTVPAYADFHLYFQYNNFNTREIKTSEGTTTGSGTGTRILKYKIGKNNYGYTWRLEDNRVGVTNYVTKAGWLKSSSVDFARTFTFHEGDYTNKYSHSFADLGTTTRTRDEAEIQAFLSPSGYKYTTEGERIRAYRLWQIIDSDASNIMIEPKFHFQRIDGAAGVETPKDREGEVLGGNAVDNWIDITPQGTAIYAVNYEALDVYTDANVHGTHGGFYPATNPERTNVFVLTNNESENGTATANILYHSNGLSSSRPTAWDYNYDNWFYLNTDTDPTLNFTVTGSGATTVQYTLVTTDKDTMESTLTLPRNPSEEEPSSDDSNTNKWRTLTPDANGNYSASLWGFRNANLAGGTVIIKMTDSSGTSYSLARVAEISANMENATNPGEDIMPGDEVTLRFDGSYRGIYKYSGIFNPTTYYLYYTEGGPPAEGESKPEYRTTVAQYQQMDQAELKLTIPENMSVPANGTADISFVNGYTYASMYSAANPFATLYNMTDVGVGTNFNAVTVSFCLNRFPDVKVTVHDRVTYNVKLDITGAPNDASPTVTLQDAAGNMKTATNGIYQNLSYGTYTYTVSCAGRNFVYDRFTLGSADQADVSDGLLTKTITLTASGANAWDGTSLTQPTLTDGIYQIGSGAELAWFAAQVNSGSYSLAGRLTADVDLAYYSWTPIGGSTANTGFQGSFDGNGHTVNNLGVYYGGTTTSAPYKGLFGYVNGTSSSYVTIQNLKVKGHMSLTSAGSVSNAYSGGVIAYANYANISGVISEVDITVTRKSGSWSYIGGLVGRMTNSTIANSSNKGAIQGYQYVGGIVGYATGTITGCYNGGEISGYGSVAGIAGVTTKAVTSCYNTGTIRGTGNYVAGIVAYASGASASVQNSFNRAYVHGDGSYVGAVIGLTNNTSAVTANLYYLDFTCDQGIGSAKSTSHTVTAVSKGTMASPGFVTTMNTGLTTAAFGSSRYSPALAWQTSLIGLSTPTKGNVNLDPFGYVDEGDLALLNEWVTEEKTANDLTAEQWAQADIDGSGGLGEEDINALIRYLEDPRANPLG